MILRSYRSLVSAYSLGEKDAKELWRKSFWFGILHPVPIIILASGLLFGFLYFDESSYVIFYFSSRNVFITSSFIVFIFFVNFFQRKYIFREMK